MINLNILKPVISLFASMIMCAILSACQSSKASTKYVNDSSAGFFSDNPQIRIQNDSGSRNYTVGSKRFSFKQLSHEQKKRINELEQKLSGLEHFVEIDSQRMEHWGEKMEAVAEQMELEAEAFEEVIGEIEFEEDSQTLERYSLKIAKASKNLEEKMQRFEKHMSAIQIEMPKLDHKKIMQLEAEAKKMERLLIEIAKDM